MLTLAALSTPELAERTMRDGNGVNHLYSLWVQPLDRAPHCGLADEVSSDTAAPAGGEYTNGERTGTSHCCARRRRSDTPGATGER